MAIADPNALLQRILQEPSESEWLEFKHNNSDPDEIGRCVSACANASMLAGKDRAFMVWGIENKTKNKLGTTVRLMKLRKGGENFQNWLTRMLTPRLMLEFFDIEDDGKSMSILAIDPTYDRPVSFGGAEYIRIGENIKPLKDMPEHERSLWLATGRRKFEGAIALSRQTDEDIFSKLDIESYYRLSGEAKPKNREETIRKFESLDFIRSDWQGGFDITNLGALLFAKNMALFPSVASKNVRVIKYKGIDKRSAENETEGQMGYAVGFSGLRKFIMDSLPKEERYEDGVRRFVSLYSEVSIREILANALIHQDFTINGAGPVIEIYDDRVEITNPGNSLIERDRIIDERRSRNEKLAKAMRDLGLCEERGGGIDKAIIDVEEKFLPAPEFFPSENSMRVVLFGPRKFADMSKTDKIWSCFCHSVVRWLRHEYMNNTTLRERFSLSTDEYQAVSAVISEARRAGRIVPADPDQGKRNAKYIPYWAGEKR
jgi:predicted HTH transcriptional regulator